MSELGYIIFFTFVSSVLSLIGGIIFLAKKNFALKISHLLTAFAAGILLGTSVFELLPESIHHAEEHGDAINVFVWFIIGILIFFFLERFIHWFHHSHVHHEHEEQQTVPLIVIGDTAHNLIDGVIIAVTFLTSIPLGIVTAIAVFAHELPQEIGDFGVLIKKGLSRKSVIIINLLSAAVSILAAIVTFTLGETVEEYLPILLSLTAGFFMYISLSDLIPDIHHENRRSFAFYESMLLLIGVLVMWLVVTSLHAPGGH